MDDRDWDEHDPSEKHDKRGRSGDTVSHDDTIGHRPNPAGRGRWLSGIVALLGGLLVVWPLVFDLEPARFADAVIVGGGLLAAGAYNAYRQSNEGMGSAGVATLGAILALWLFVTPFLLGTDGGTIGGLVDVVVGVTAFLMSAYSAWEIRVRRRAADPRPTAIYDRRGQ